MMLFFVVFRNYLFVKIKTICKVAASAGDEVEAVARDEVVEVICEYNDAAAVAARRKKGYSVMALVGTAAFDEKLDEDGQRDEEAYWSSHRRGKASGSSSGGSREAAVN